jgi:hypothetical protein
MNALLFSISGNAVHRHAPAAPPIEVQVFGVWSPPVAISASGTQ